MVGAMVMKRPEVAWLIALAVPGAGVTVFAWALITGHYGAAVGIMVTMFAIATLTGPDR